MNLPLRWKLVLWYILSVTVIVAALAVFVVLKLRTDLTASVQRSVDAAARQIDVGYAGGGEASWHEAAAAALVSLPRDDSGAQLLDRSGAVRIAHGDDVAHRLLLPRPDVRSAANGRMIARTLTLGPGAEPFVLAARSLQSREGSVIVVATSLQSVQESVNRLIALLSIAGPAALLVTAGAGWWIARQALLPVTRMREDADVITVDQLERRVSVPNRSDEIGRLAVTFNAMLDRLQSGVEDQRRFVADASHELRTPLAVMRSEVDVALLGSDGSSPVGDTRPTRGDLSFEAREALLSVREEIDRMSRMAANLLILAEVDEGKLGLRTAAVDMDLLAGAVRREMEPIATEKSIDLSVTGASVRVMGDEDHLRRVLRNLLENAVEYTPRGGKVNIHLWELGDRGAATVSDTGPGIAKATVPRIFDRFVREEQARSRSVRGSGLGLAICRAIIEAQEGDLWVETEVGRGSAFSFSLPTASATEAGGEL
ncbi:ATP-binding protein [soil metagenome]